MHPCSGGVCTADGHCIRTDSGTREPRDGAPADNTCASVNVGANRTTPNVLLIVDRSGSMTEELADMTRRWDALQNALIANPDGVIFPLQSSVRFGLALYTEADRPRSCPDLFTVPTALDNFSAIEALYTDHQPGGGTPTGESIQAILDRLDELVTAPDQPTVFVLATDGEPNTCADPREDPQGRPLALQAVQDAFDQDIRTFVIGVDREIGADHLQELANAGVGNAPGATPGAEYWVATDAAGLANALESIVGSVVSCTIELEGTIDPVQACDGEVRLGGELLTCGTDWQAIDGNTIELLDAACDRLQSSGAELTASFPCGVIII